MNTECRYVDCPTSCFYYCHLLEGELLEKRMMWKVVMKCHAAFPLGNGDLVSWMIVLRGKLQKELGCRAQTVEQMRDVGQSW